MSQEGDDETPRRAGTSGNVEGLVDDVFGVDFKVPRTLRDLVIRPVRVFDAAAANDHSRYTRPVRLFLALAALQFLIFGLAETTQTLTFSAMFEDQPAALTAAQARLAAVGASLEQADEVIQRWFGWLNWPLTILMSLALVLVLWMLRPSMGLFRSFMMYLTILNASTVVALPFLLAAAFFGAQVLSLTSLASILVFLIYAGIVMHGRVAETALGLSVRLGVLFATFAPMVVAMNILAVAILEFALRAEVGAGWLEVLVTGLEARS